MERSVAVTSSITVAWSTPSRGLTVTFRPRIPTFSCRRAVSSGTMPSGASPLAAEPGLPRKLAA